MAAEKFIEEKLAGTEYGFSLENLMTETGLSNVAARNQLLRLRRDESAYLCAARLRRELR
jgi:hypothetical protein